MNYKKIKNTILNHFDISIFYSFGMMVIMVICVFLANNFEYSRKANYVLPSIVILCIGIALLVVCYCILKKIIKLDDKQIDRIIFIFSGIFTIFLFFIARSYAFKTGWDVTMILKNAECMANNNNGLLSNEYYSIYPNNILLTQIYSIAFRIANVTKISNGYNYLLLFQAFIYSFTGWLTYKICSMIFENKVVPVLGWLIYVFLMGLSPWIVIPYSDSIALFLVSLIAYNYLKIVKDNCFKKRCFYIIILAILSITGYFIKPQIIIFLVAICLVTMVTKLKEIKKFVTTKNNYLYILSFILASIITFSSISLITKVSGFNLNKEKKFGITHFLMMGWNYEGGGVWNREDVKFSESFETNKERNQANIAEYKVRVSNMKTEGIINLMVRKTLTNYNDGTFSYGGEGQFFLDEYPIGNIKLRKVLNKVYKRNGDYFKYYQLIMQIIWMGVLFFNIFSLNKKRDNRIYVMQLSILGLTLFELLFEARARYLFAYAPIYIIIACVGTENVFNYIRKRRRRV